MRCCWALSGLVTATSLLLPGWAAAESVIPAGTHSGKLSATAHVHFKIVIPEVLSLGVAGAHLRDSGAPRVAIYSNTRNVTLAASSGSTNAARNGVVLRAVAGRVIARDAVCQLPADTRGGAAATTIGMICTVAMP